MENLLAFNKAGHGTRAKPASLVKIGCRFFVVRSLDHTYAGYPKIRIINEPSTFSEIVALIREPGMRGAEKMKMEDVRSAVVRQLPDMSEIEYLPKNYVQRRTAERVAELAESRDVWKLLPQRLFIGDSLEMGGYGSET